MQYHNVKFIGRYYGHDRPDNFRSLGNLEEEAMNKLLQEISQTSTYPNNIVYNLTWVPIKGSEEIINLFESNDRNTTKFWFVGFVDETYSFLTDEIYNHYKQLNYNISLVGNAGEHFYTIFPKLLIERNKFLDNVELKNLNYHFLSYNRKPKTHRYNLVKRIITNNLLDKGFVTFDKGVFKEIDDRIDTYDRLNYSGSNVEYKSQINSVDKLSRPEDIGTLGDLSIWRSSYCVVVTETFDYCRYQTSEKIWKPIFGKRPFLLVAHPSCIEILKRLNFYTPSDLFADKSLDNCTIGNNINFLRKLCEKSSQQIMNLYHQQKEMIDHNHNRFVEIAEFGSNKILNWPY